MVELLVIVGVVAGIVAWRKRGSRRGLSRLPAYYGQPQGSYTRPPSAGQQAPPEGQQDIPEPVELSGYIQELSVQAMSEINMVLGSSHNPREQQTYQEVADFLAALRYYRRAVAAAYSDDLIKDGLGAPGPFIEAFINNYRQAPRGNDRDQAIAILERLENLYGKGVIVAMARLVIDKLQALGY